MIRTETCSTRQKFKTITASPLNEVICVVDHVKRSWDKDKSMALHSSVPLAGTTAWHCRFGTETYIQIKKGHFSVIHTNTFIHLKPPAPCIKPVGSMATATATASALCKLTFTGFPCPTARLTCRGAFLYLPVWTSEQPIGCLGLLIRRVKGLINKPRQKQFNVKNNLGRRKHFYHVFHMGK